MLKNVVLLMVAALAGDSEEVVNYFRRIFWPMHNQNKGPIGFRENER